MNQFQWLITGSQSLLYICNEDGSAFSTITLGSCLPVFSPGPARCLSKFLIKHMEY